MARRRRQYVRALDVLPLDVVRRISDACGGGEAFIFVPATDPAWRTKREQQVVDLFDQGLRVDEIASAVFITERSVWRILARRRASAAPSATAVRPPQSNPQQSQ